MIRHLAIKGLIIVTSLFAVVTATFCIMHALPGDPFAQDQAMPEEVLKALHEHYGLDQPLVVQYARYLEKICMFDLGFSLKYQGRTVNQIIVEGFPVSFLLGVEALSIAVIGGVALGIIAAVYHLRWQERLALLIGLAGISVPSFLLGTFLQYFLAMKLDLFPIARWDTISSSILPAATLSAFPLAFICRLIRANMLEVLQKEYILSARAKGIGVATLIWRHALPNALVPALGYLGPLITAVFTGSFVIEKIFGIPGLGQWLVASISNRDYTVIMGLTIFYSAILMISVWIVDCASCLLDPRIKKELLIGANA